MKKLKKLLALVLTLAICATFALPALAEGEGTANPTTQIIMESVTEGHTYYVYQIYTGTISGETGSYVLSDVRYGENYTGKTTGDKVPEEELKGIETSGAEAFAKTFDPSGDPAAILDSDNTATGELAPGYYLVKDMGVKNADGSFAPATGEGAVNSAFMVQLVGTDVKVTPKTSVPEVDKTVEEAEEEIATAKQEQMNKELVFHLKATLPEDDDFAAYPEYKVEFTDTMGKGLTFDSLESVTIKVGDGEAINVPEKSGENEVGYVLAGIAPGEKGQKIWTVTIDDIKKIEGVSDITGGVVIEVTYKGHLNEEATVVTSDGDKDGNSNKVKLTYSNNPEGEGTGETKEKEVFVFTFGLDNFKYVMEDGKKVAKEGAGFTLYKEDGTEVIPLYKLGDAYYVYSGDESELPEGATRLDGEGVNKYEMTSDSDGHFDVKGLAEGTYVLKETTTPTGFNTAEDTTIEISATYKEEGGKTVVDTVTVKVNGKENAASTDTSTTGGTSIEIENKKGSTLPSTGGIGTTIFYIVGAVLVVGAGVLLFTKRRARG